MDCSVRGVNTGSCSCPAQKKTWSRVGARYLGAIFEVEGAALMASSSAPVYSVIALRQHPLGGRCGQLAA